MSSADLSSYEFSRIPFAEIVRVGQRSLLYNDMFCVSWLLGRYCNYSCSYCWPYASSKVKDHRPGSLIRKTMDEIKRQARERGFNSFHFSFSGGEPTLHPEYLEILGHYATDTPQTNYQSVHMTTNLSQGKAWFERYAEATASLHRVSVTASFHKEFAKKEPFLEKLSLLQEKDIQVTINMVLSPDRFDASWEDALFFHEGGVNVTLKPQSDERAAKIVPGYTDEQLRLLREGMPQREYTKERLRKIAR
ncbi:MAG TPA: radical SAM protein, partial [Pseudobdellovibrionaceae bacterium]|nr:radical SAM protein [Pseudobdellovibrionaceae bacterium]